MFFLTGHGNHELGCMLKNSASTSLRTLPDSSVLQMGAGTKEGSLARGNPTGAVGLCLCKAGSSRVAGKTACKGVLTHSPPLLKNGQHFPWKA